MSIRMGATPIGGSNDDRSEIGGRAPLDTCRAEARGEVGVRAGRAAPRSPRSMRTDVFIAAATSHAIHGRRDRR